jgi:hypothetical protein
MGEVRLDVSKITRFSLRSPSTGRFARFSLSRSPISIAHASRKRDLPSKIVGNLANVG